MRILLSHPTGSQYLREAARALQEADLLAEFFTTVARRKTSSWDIFLPGSVRAEFRRRAYDDKILAVTRARPARELMRLGLSRCGLQRFVRAEDAAFAFDSIARDLDRAVARRVRRGGPDTVYAYEDAALDTFRAAKKAGIRRIYELPVGYWKFFEKVMEEERELAGEYTAILAGISDSAEKRERKDLEIGLAEHIMVPSSFVAKTLEAYEDPIPKVSVVNYGGPDRVAAGPTEGNGKLRVLFVGSLQQRKGISYLVEATNGMSNLISITLIGGRVAACRPLDAWLSEQKWIPTAPHATVLETMGRNDVLVLPSLSEGLAQVILEAMSQGLTVIVSENTGATDIVTDGVDGFIVPIRSPEAIAEKLELLAREPDRLHAMKLAALETARRNTWERYRANLVRVVRSLGAISA